jgi:hypothetical protein
VIECNCSICSRRGHWLTFVAADQFQLLQGADTLTDYQFNTHKHPSQFLQRVRRRLVSPGARVRMAPRWAAINVRCLDDIDLASVKTTKFDGEKPLICVCVAAHIDEAFGRGELSYAKVRAITASRRPPR